jgi:hypothetical protein
MSGPALKRVAINGISRHYIGDAKLYRNNNAPRKPRQTCHVIHNLRERLRGSEDDRTQHDADAPSIGRALLEFAQAGADPRPIAWMVGNLTADLFHAVLQRALDHRGSSIDRSRVPPERFPRAPDEKAHVVATPATARNETQA